MSAPGLRGAAAALVPDVAVVGTIRARGDEETYLVQVAGRGQDVVARSVSGIYGIGEAVIVLLEPNEQMPVILGSSPWMAHDPSAVVSPITLHWADIVDAEETCSANADVAANTATRHARGHAMASPDDHDAEGMPAHGDIFGYTAATAKWGPRGAPRAAMASANLLMLMGM